MAEIKYAGSEPKVTVHNLPKSEYDAGSSGVTAPSAGGGILQHFKDHWKLYTLGLGALTIVVIIWVSNNNSATAATSASTLGTNSSGAGGTSSADTFGSQLDADYQQMIANENTNTGILNQILSQGGTPGPAGPQGPAGNNGTNGSNIPGVAGKNTAGMSNNFWVYITKPGDTLSSLTSKFKWGSDTNKTVNYRNNSDILHAVGYDVTHPNQALPTGIAISA